MLWRTSPASTELEEVTLDWLRQMLGLGCRHERCSSTTRRPFPACMRSLPRAKGVELRIREEGMSGRKDLPLLRVYASEQAHSSIDKGIITLGLGQRALRKIPSDTEFRMDPKALADAIDEDKRNGIVPFCIVATVGTTSTSSIDPVPAIVEIWRAARDVAPRRRRVRWFGGDCSRRCVTSRRLPRAPTRSY